MNENATLEARIERLETQVRRARVVGMASAALLGTVLLGSMQSRAEKEITVERVTARQFDLVDEQGHRRGFLGFDGRPGPEEKAVSLSLWSAESNTRLLLRADNSVSELILRHGPTGSAAWAQAGGDGGFFSAGSSVKGAEQATNYGATLSSKDCEGRLFLLKQHLEPEFSKGGQVAFVSKENVELTPTAGLVRK